MKIIIAITFCLFSFISVIAQNIITGNVSDITGPLPFANVVISGTDVGTITDAKGYFSIETKKGEVLLISYVGYTSKHILLNTTKHLDISLENDSLKEVVIVGYSSSRSFDTGTISSVSSNLVNVSLKSSDYCELGKNESDQKTSATIQQTDSNFNGVRDLSRIYPNPSSSGYFTLDFLDTYDSLEISIVAVTGQIIVSRSYTQPKNIISLDLSRFSTGIYIVHTIADGKRLTAQKLIRS